MEWKKEKEWKELEIKPGIDTQTVHQCQHGHHTPFINEEKLKEKLLEQQSFSITGHEFILVLSHIIIVI